MRLQKKPHHSQYRKEINNSELWTIVGIVALYAIAGSLFFLKKRSRRPIGKKIDIEIRYDTEKNADTTFLAQNIVKIIRMVLTPLEHNIEKEGAGLIFVFGDNSWEMLVRNGSEHLKSSVRTLLENKDW